MIDKKEQLRRVQAFEEAQKLLGKTAPSLPIPVKANQAPLSMNNKRFEVGQTVLHPHISGNSAYISVRKVSKIDEHGKVFLDGSNICLKAPERCYIL